LIGRHIEPLWRGARRLTRQEKRKKLTQTEIDLHEYFRDSCATMISAMIPAAAARQVHVH
jgi:hypothetical protein